MYFLFFKGIKHISRLYTTHAYQVNLAQPKPILERVKVELILG